MELEDLKNSWKEMEKRIGETHDEVMALKALMKLERTESRKNKLARQLRLKGAACFCCVGMFNMPFMRDLLSNTTVLCVMAFMLIMGAFHLYFSCAVKRIDFCGATVSETLRQIVRVEKLQRYGFIFGTTLVVPVLVLMLIDFHRTGDPYIIYSSYGGLVIGLVMGFFMRRRIMNAFKEMKAAFSEGNENEE